MNDVKGWNLSSCSIQNVENVAHLRERHTVLGKGLFSVRLAGVSFCYSLASVGLVFWFISVLAERTQGILSIGGVVFLVGFLYGTVPIKLHKSSQLWIWSSPLILLALIFLLFFLGGPGKRYLLWLFFGVLSCAAFLVLTRIVLSWISRVRSIRMITAILLLNCLPLVLLFLLYLATFGWHSVNEVDSATASFFEPILYSAVMSAIPAVFSLVFVLLSLTVIVHRAVWRSMQSPIYALQEAGIERRKKIFGYVGASLIGVSGVSAVKPLAHFLSSLMK